MHCKMLLLPGSNFQVFSSQSTSKGNAMPKAITVSQLYKAELERRLSSVLRMKNKEKREKATARAHAAVKLRRRRANYILKIPQGLRPKKNCVQSAKERLHRWAWEAAGRLETADI
jgi:hypothetical protein